MTGFDLTGTDLTDTGTEVDWETSLKATLTASEGFTDSEAGAGTELLSEAGAGTEDLMADTATWAACFLLSLRFSVGVR